MRAFLINFGLIFSVFVAKSQDLNKFSKEKGVSLGGNMTVTQIFALQNNDWHSRSVLQGNITLGLFGYQLPLGFMYSDQQGNFNHPFHQIRINPKYKNFTFNAGSFSHSYSPYTVGGKPIKGAGIRFRKNDLELQSMLGKPVHIGLEKNTVEPFQNYHFGMSASFRYKNRNWKITGLIGIDSVGSNPLEETQNKVLAKNKAMSISGAGKLLKNINYTFEYGYSHLQKASNYDQKFTEHFHAIKTSVNHSSKFGQLSLNYERIDPQYQTLLLNFINNDVENISVSHSGMISKGKVSLRNEIGVQQNNLDKSKLSEQKNIAYRSNINLKLGRKSNLTLLYSTFRNKIQTFYYPEFSALPEYPDSLIVTDINTQAQVRFNRQFALGTKSSLNFSAGYQVQTLNNPTSQTKSEAWSGSVTGNIPGTKITYGGQFMMDFRGKSDHKTTATSYSFFTRGKLPKEFMYSIQIAIRSATQNQIKRFTENYRLQLSRKIGKNLLCSSGFIQTTQHSNDQKQSSRRIQMQIAFKL